MHSRRASKTVFLALFALSSLFLAENRIEAFVPVTEPVEPAASRAVAPVGGVATEYNVQELLSEMKRACAGAAYIGRGRTVSIDFTAHDGSIDGFAVIKGSLSDLRASGSVSVRGKGRFGFSGSLKGERFSVEIRQGAGSIRADGEYCAGGAVSLRLKADRIKVAGSEISFTGHLKNRRAAPEAGDSGLGRLEGEFEAFGATLNGRRIPDISGGYSYAGDLLKVSGMRVGHGLAVSGCAFLRKPGAMDLVVTADNVSLSRLFLEFGAGTAAPQISGTLNGRFAFKGPFAKPAIEARFDIRKGAMGAVDFESLFASVRGEAPFMKIDEAAIARKSGRMELYGEFDMRDIGKNRFFGNIRTQADDGAMTWDGWACVDSHGATETRMSKNVTSDIGLTYKKRGRSGAIDESVRDPDEVRLEYRLSPNESLGLMLGQDRDYLGFEHRDEF